MITVQQAFQIIEDKVKTLPPITLPLLDCLELTAAESLTAPIDVPVFDNSAMDGYAFRFEDFLNNIPLKINYTIEAGNSESVVLKQGEAARIFTGAPIPVGADTVVQQEICRIDNGLLSFTKEIKKGSNIRARGTQTKKGSPVLEVVSFLTAEYISFLATLGISEIKVYPKPKVGIIVTGNELAQPGRILDAGQIYESNSITLKALLRKMNIETVFTEQISDNKEFLSDFVQSHAGKVDVLLFTGGISVGDYDFVKPVLEQLNAEEFFYKVRQKPGKPLYFGALGKTFVWGLPGNPGSVLTCFHIYVKPFLNAMAGQKTIKKKQYGILITPYHKKPGLTQFVKAYMEDHKIKILDSQLSYQMDSFSKANGYAVLKEEQENFQAGEKLEFIFF